MIIEVISEMSFESEKEEEEAILYLTNDQYLEP